MCVIPNIFTISTVNCVLLKKKEIRYIRLLVSGNRGDLKNMPLSGKRRGWGILHTIGLFLPVCRMIRRITWLAGADRV